MFTCRKCNQNRYLKFEEYIYICKDCNKNFQICCDCFMENYSINNLNILKKKLDTLFRYIIDLTTYLNKIMKQKKISSGISIRIKEYISEKYLYTRNNKKYNFNKFNYDIQYISPFGLQLKGDDSTNEFYSNPIFYCNNCLQKYDYYCLFSNKLY